MSIERKVAGAAPVIGIIGGSGVYESGLFETKESHRVSTPWGGPSSLIEEGEIGGVKTFFLARHGKGHTVPAHRVNYRANIDALKSLGVEAILTINSVGSLKEDLTPGTFVLPDQFIDWTKSRPTTFYEGGRTYHVSMADPICPALMSVAAKVAEQNEGMHVASGKTYVCVEGPRFSTRAESRLFRTFADIIGMTLVPECQLAREREMCYLAICMVTDYDVWSEHPVVATDIVRTLNSNVNRVRNWLRDIVPRIPKERRCSCQRSLENAAV
jgi:5'-methylthioadenosine phosphorylase